MRCGLLAILLVTALQPGVHAQELTEDMLKRTETIAAALEDIAPEGWVADGAVERYTVENMYDKINGRAELYVSYDVVGMTFVTLVPEDESDRTTYIDIFLYDMQLPENAYGVYGVERWPGNTPVKLGRDAYRAGADLFLWHGQYYATLLGAADKEGVHAAAHAMAKTLTERLKDSGGEVWWDRLMPKGNRMPDTLQFFRVDAMSMDFMTNTCTAEYELDGREITFFLSRQDSEETAQNAYGRFKTMMEAYGEDVKLDEESAPPLLSADMGGGYFDVLFRHRHFIGGVSAVPDLGAAIAAAQKLFGEVKQKLDADTPG